MHANSLAPDSNPTANPSGSGLFAWMRRKFCAKPSVNTIRLLLLLAMLYARALVGPGGKGFEDFLVFTYILAIVYFWTIPARDRHLYFLTIPSRKVLGIAFIVGISYLATEASILLFFYDGHELANPFLIILFSPLHFVIKFIFNAFPEEIFFRGFLWGELRRFNFSHFSILCISSILFWAGHWFHFERPDVWINNMVAGLIFGIVAWKTKSFLSSSIVHSISNMLPMVMQTII
jgi:membrane protease YdiL (CAAX protease family)